VRSTSPEQFGPLSLPVIPEPDITRFESELTACPDCGLAQRIRRPKKNQIATCVRCGAVLEAPGSVGLTAPLALAITGIFLAAVANLSPFLTVRLAGAVRPSRLITGPLALGHEGLGSLGLLVAALSILIPLVWLGNVSYVLASLQFDRKSPSLAQRFRLAERLRPLAMVDVFLLGSFVAFTRLRDLATVDIGPGGWALAALAVTMVAIDTTLDRRLVWDLIETPHRASRPSGAGWRSCAVCGLMVAGSPARCPRCASHMRDRKPNSLARTAALVIAGFILYVPANLLPVLTVIRFGRAHPNTILSGIRELFGAQIWPLALIVLVASVVVPLLKLCGLTWLMISVRRKSSRLLLQRTRLYRAIRAVGRWANIDVFAVSTLVSLVQFGSITSIEPNTGAAVFAAVVVVTMVAAETFDPRLMWDAAEGRHVG
jgi:paraquat-inducible protein A